MSFTTEEKRFRLNIYKTPLENWIGRIWSKPKEASRFSSPEKEFEFSADHKIDVVRRLEGWILEFHSELDILLNVQAGWRRRAEGEPCSEKQWAIIAKKGLTRLPREQISKAKAMLILSAYFDKRQ